MAGSHHPGTAPVDGSAAWLRGGAPERGLEPTRVPVPGDPADTSGTVTAEQMAAESLDARPPEEPEEPGEALTAGPRDEEADLLGEVRYPEDPDDDPHHWEEEAEGRYAEEAAVRIATAEDADEEPYSG